MSIKVIQFIKNQYKTKKFYISFKKSIFEIPNTRII